MKLKKTVAVILCVAMLAALLLVSAGCNGDLQYYYEDGPQESESPPDALAPQEGASMPGMPVHVDDVDFAAVFDAFAPDTVMVTAGGLSITWEELYFNIYGVIFNELVPGFGGVPDMSHVVPDGRSIAEIVLDHAVDNALMFRSIEFGANEAGVALGDDDLAILELEYESMLLRFGGMDEMLDILWEHDGIRSFELFKYLISINYLAGVLFEARYGANGELLTDADVEAIASIDGYLMAKHILRLKTEDDDDAPRDAIEDVLRQLDAYRGDDFGAFFDTLMHEHSEDGGLFSFPNGYLFQHGDMVPEFYDATVALEIGGHSGIVETVYGFHIVYRIPIDFDAIPASSSRTHDFRTLRLRTAYSVFDFDMLLWRASLTPEFTAAYESLDLASLFAQ
jgi:hypothetical protein